MSRFIESKIEAPRPDLVVHGPLQKMRMNAAPFASLTRRISCTSARVSGMLGRGPNRFQAI